MREPNTTRPAVVLGVLDTPRGREIAERMQVWLQQYGYSDVHIYRHDGSRFEYPALIYAQRYSVESGKPVLYLHTRGAVNTWPTTEQTHRMWEHEFGKLAGFYATLINAQSEACVIAPFIDNNCTHRYNGFVANSKAWALAVIHENVERHAYEHLWRGTGVRHIGLKVHSNENRIKEIREMLAKEYA